MTIDLRGRSFLKEVDFTKQEFTYLINEAEQLREEKHSGREVARLVGRNIALIFEKTSTRTRSAFEVAAHDQGAHVTYLGPDDSQLGHKESIRDTARVLGGCSTESNIVVSPTTRSRCLRSTQGYRSGMA